MNPLDIPDRPAGSLLSRRGWLATVGTLAIAGAGAGGVALRRHDEAGWRADVVVARAESYSADIADIIRRGLAELGLGPAWVKGRSVLLKPNLVEPSLLAPQVNTHPAVVRGAAEVFRSWGAREVFVAEGQGHCRDTAYVLEQSGLGPVLDDEQLDFVDLNHDDIFAARNRSGWTKLDALHLPTTLKRADLVVSMPKLKTHHWVGVTLAMKNLFGVMPGIAYGWPKNVLHQHGIEASILDINAAVRPSLAIVDGIVGMEGDGPLMGSPVAAGVLVLGTNFPAVDATASRLMGVDPVAVPYLAATSGWLGPIAEAHIRQRGEPIAPLARRFIPAPRAGEPFTGSSAAVPAPTHITDCRLPIADCRLPIADCRLPISLSPPFAIGNLPIGNISPTTELSAPTFAPRMLRPCPECRLVAPRCSPPNPSKNG